MMFVISAVSTECPLEKLRFDGQKQNPAFIELAIHDLSTAAGNITMKWSVLHQQTSLS